MIDVRLFHSIHDLARKNDSVDWIMSQSSSWGYILFISIIFLLLLFPTYRKVGVTGFVTLAIALGLNKVLKSVFDRPRPFVEHEVDILISKEPSPSFPSDQALIAGVFAGVFLFSSFKKTIKIIVLVVALLVVFSRVFVGHHYPSDVAVGFLLGLSISFVTKKRMAYISLRKKKSVQAV
ncbi:phosphatase PAP2 family protein [Aquibacillus koreensis]|uniref:Phosphatase PAP2 family protein n=1 Tax=Aquibacillus koreensis TaxID=279446 RepID=A0A9X3WMP9_9BACI|nr:phosphatase PAP2 family protein [Aquibacillus koreensis]MCT2537240.1 phosphatase PAP2 family protein [Aquibacillus koreensis]MDC3421588.1 phosphatase PAP2 family protein [Aquibacillus koreensis]